uniref:SGNH hydrolase-type esterase domain-containing protein n=1 Tax=uncultured sludge bacterium TaxID=641485 RepID=E0WCK4_9BACT|nr:hypothetical protein [uncultured sludge bacterium]
MQTARVIAVPGRKYTLTITARGEGGISLGAVEFADRYSPMRVGTPSQSFELTPQWQTFTFTFTPSDATMYLSPFFEATGWLGHADIRNPSLEDTVAPGKISIAASDYVFDLGSAVTLALTTDHGPVKLLLYGPGGVPAGPGGPFGGSDAWIDHFQQAFAIDSGPGVATTVTIELHAEALPGFYRAVAVDLTTGQTATTNFSLYPKATADEFRSLASKIKLPDGAKLVFLGDSLTDFYRGRNYVDLVSRAIAKTHGDKVQVFNAGIGGNNIDQIEKRLTKDVIERKATHVFIFEGANDSKRNYNPASGLKDVWALPYELHEATYRKVVERIRDEAGAKVIVMTMAPGDQRILEPFRERARAFKRSINFFCLPEDTAKAVALQKQIARDFQLPVIDTHAHLQAILDRNETAEYLHVDDGVHISEHGNREVALLVLRYLAATYK